MCDSRTGQVYNKVSVKVKKKWPLPATFDILGYKVCLPRHSWFFRPLMRNANRWRL
jgi:hypothetical protein